MKNAVKFVQLNGCTNCTVNVAVFVSTVFSVNHSPLLVRTSGMTVNLVQKLGLYSWYSNNTVHFIQTLGLYKMYSSFTVHRVQHSFLHLGVQTKCCSKIQLFENVPSSARLTNMQATSSYFLFGVQP